MNHGHDDFEFEPIRGLPARLPEGERILWQGEPRWQTVAFQVFHVRLVAIYFAVLYGWGVATALADGAPLTQALTSGAMLAPLAVLAIGVLTLLAWLVGRTTVYTITNRRVAMRIGAALTMTLNLPFRKIRNANLKLRKDGTGTIALELEKEPGAMRLSYVMTWPHVRPWRMKHTEPALRCIPDAEAVARTFADAAETAVAEPVIERVPEAQPVAAE